MTFLGAFRLMGMKNPGLKAKDGKFYTFVGGGPVLLSIFITNIFKTTTSSHPVKMSKLSNLLHLIFGLLFCSAPLTYGAWLVFDKN